MDDGCLEEFIAASFSSWKTVTLAPPYVSELRMDFWNFDLLRSKKWKSWLTKVAHKKRLMCATFVESPLL
jgi:hypothetical protein